MNVVLLDELKSLILGPSIGGQPQGKDLIGWSHMINRISVAIKAPTHRERRSAMNNFHLINATVTLHATHTTRDMGGVIEICVVAKLVNLDPLDRHSSFITFANLGNLWAVLMNLRVAVHASLCRWHRCMRSNFNGVVAVATIHSQFACVQRVAKRHWLNRLILPIKGLWAEPIGHKQCDVERSDCACDKHEGKQRVRPSGEQESAHIGKSSETGDQVSAARGHARQLCEIFHKVSFNMVGAVDDAGQEPEEFWVIPFLLRLEEARLFGAASSQC